MPFLWSNNRNVQLKGFHLLLVMKHLMTSSLRLGKTFSKIFWCQVNWRLLDETQQVPTEQFLRLQCDWPNIHDHKVVVWWDALWKTGPEMNRNLQFLELGMLSHQSFHIIFRSNEQNPADSWIKTTSHKNSSRISSPKKVGGRLLPMARTQPQRPIPCIMTTWRREFFGSTALSVKMAKKDGWMDGNDHPNMMIDDHWIQTGRKWMQLFGCFFYWFWKNKTFDQWLLWWFQTSKLFFSHCKFISCLHIDVQWNISGVCKSVEPADWHLNHCFRIECGSKVAVVEKLLPTTPLPETPSFWHLDRDWKGWNFNSVYLCLPCIFMLGSFLKMIWMRFSAMTEPLALTHTRA